MTITRKALPTVNTLGEFRRWTFDALPGDSVIYYEGHLMVDRQAASESAAYLSKMADVILTFAESREIHLTQRRIGFNHYEYRATRTSPRNMALMEATLRRAEKDKRWLPIRAS